jgi:hypothetical protein
MASTEAACAAYYNYRSVQLTGLVCSGADHQRSENVR